MNDSAAIWLDGSNCNALPLPDRGLDFGDGLFETLLLRDGNPLFPELHLDRLALGLERLYFPPCLDRVRADLASVVAELRHIIEPWAVLRITVSRGGGPRGYAPPESTRPRIVIKVTPLDRDCGVMLPPAKLSVSSIRWPCQPLLAGLKHLNRLEQVLAAREARETRVEDSLMLDQQGQLVSAIAGNLFLVKGGALYTPELEQCGIAGTRRRLVIERWARELGLRVHAARLGLPDLSESVEVFISSSLVGLRAVASIGEFAWQQHDLCNALFQRYLEDIG